MNLPITGITVEIRPSNKPGPVKAYADVTLHTSEGMLHEKGYAVIQKDGGLPFVGPPSRRGSTPGKWFPIVEAEGDIRMAIYDAILRRYRQYGQP
jgi:DNA-binding cell septation regulator SpoVG